MLKFYFPHDESPFPLCLSSINLSLVLSSSNIRLVIIAAGSSTLPFQCHQKCHRFFFRWKEKPYSLSSGLRLPKSKSWLSHSFGMQLEGSFSESPFPFSTWSCIYSLISNMDMIIMWYTSIRIGEVTHEVLSRVSGTRSTQSYFSLL
jgi:hypothetical protein